MKAENKTTGHNRTIRLTEIPQQKDSDLAELVITINYVQDNEVGVIFQAVTLDNVVIPAIIAALNNQ